MKKTIKPQGINERRVRKGYGGDLIYFPYGGSPVPHKVKCKRCGQFKPNREFRFSRNICEGCRDDNEK